MRGGRWVPLLLLGVRTSAAPNCARSPLDPHCQPPPSPSPSPPPPGARAQRAQPLRSALAALASTYASAGSEHASTSSKHDPQPQPVLRCRGRQCSQPRSPPSAPPPAPPSPGALSPFSYARWSAEAGECASAPVPAPKAGARVHTFELDGRTRRFILRTPPQAAVRTTVATPLVLELPGSHETAEHAAARSQLGATGAKYGFLVASLEGVDQLFNVGADARLESERGPDEVRYVAAVLEAVARLACVDRRRVFASGFSRGARLTARLASELPDAIAAIGPVAGLRYPAPNNATRAVPVLAVHGLADAINPYAGGGPTYWRSGVPDAVGGWVAHNRCAPAPTSEPLGAHSARVEWSGCADGAKVVLVLLAGAGHSYPGCGHAHTGHCSVEVSTNELLWEFFMQHPMPTAPTRLGRKPAGAHAALGAEAAPRAVAAGALSALAAGAAPPASGWARTTRGGALVGMVALFLLGARTRRQLARPIATDRTSGEGLVVL